MPSHERVKTLIEYVVNRRFMDALKEFYHEDSALQENNGEPRIGLQQNLQHEERFLAAVDRFHEVRARSFIVDGDLAAIRWTMEATLRCGKHLKRDEIAYQRWSDDKIICEQYFYDPCAQEEVS